MALEISPNIAVHPGTWLRDEIITPSNLSPAALAKLLGLSHEEISSLLNGEIDLTADLAIRFEKQFGVAAETLSRMQYRYSANQAVS